MRLLSFRTPDGRRTWGTHRNGWVVDVGAAMHERWPAGDPPPFADVASVLRAGEEGLDRVRAVTETESWEPGDGRPGYAYHQDEVAWLPPVPRARMFSMRGNNPILLRLDGLLKPAFPTVTPRHPAGLVGHGQDIVLREQDGAIGWGAEVVAIIGTDIKDVGPRQAAASIAGYTVTNDFSGSCFVRCVAPDLVRGSYTYRDEHFAGKFYGTWSMPQPVGPWLVTADEIRDPYRLTVRATENGVLCDTVTTAAMLFSFEEIIAFLSRFMTLRSGDMVSSGALGYHVIDGLYRYAEGSSLLVEVEGLGGLRNPIVDRRGTP